MPPLHVLLVQNGDVDASLELALLQLWAADDPKLIAKELLALDDKCWQRMGLLLFASNHSLVLALVAILERMATGSSCDQLFQRMWVSRWWDHLQEKVVDCHTQLEREDIRSKPSGRTDSLFLQLDLVAIRLVPILVTIASLYFSMTSMNDDQCKDQIDWTTKEGGLDAPKVMEVVDLLLSLSANIERSPAVARAAAEGLQSLLLLQPHALTELITTHICRSRVFLDHVTWLLGDNGVISAAASPIEPSNPSSSFKVGKAPNAKLNSQHECNRALFELLVAAATAACSDANQRRGARSTAFDDTAAMLHLCTLGLASSDSKYQSSALRLLCSLLVFDDASSSALSSAVRLSGILISISWLLNHKESTIAALAATTLKVVIRHSPSSDILRAVIEQGCVIIYRTLLWMSSGSMQSPARAEVATSCRSLLDWVTDEVAQQSSVVSASVQSLLSSTNTLLQKNLILTLQILAQRSAVIRDALEELDFRTDALVTAIQADDDASLAVSLLSICLSCCDKYSTLKIMSGTKDGSALFRHHNTRKQQEGETERAAELDEHDGTIQLQCADGKIVEASAALLCAHSNLLYEWKSEKLCRLDSPLLVTKLNTFPASRVQLCLDLLSMTQENAVSALTKRQSLTTLQELLHLAHAICSAKCWHVITCAICWMMTVSNWLDIFLFASLEVRHPTLVLRCIRFALQLQSALGPRSHVEQMPSHDHEVDPAGQERARLASALKTAAIQMSDELLTGCNTFSSPPLDFISHQHKQRIIQ